ncbi:nitroreductase family protein [Halalkalibacter sp. APA_J-10(15)]|uniref:nitroreductase family protein n=1 Tax=Halalkalibacter sp. APA_J-10(15) TaxID=2933805 RepID=UPI001FF12A51|nr:nitroreductase family protein [Halalkalibacter sp. APA_J-10(15)]MCK0471950.1 nitroreductase family protein [Halalkalibacter sp. APA_J-10(15)]
MGIQEQLASAITVMNNRHSVKHYKPGLEITREEMTELLEAATSAPSAWNLQHWRFLVIDDQKKKEELLPIAYYQQQIVDSSAVIVLLGDCEAGQEASEIYDVALEKGQLTKEVRDALVSQIERAYEHGKETSFARDAAFLNASLAGMQFMLAAKEKGYDTCPIGGFKRDELIKTFHIPQRFVPVMLMTVGTTLKEAYPSERKPIDQVTVYNSF